MTYKAKKYYQNKDVAGRYYIKRFTSLSGKVNHYLEKSFLRNVIHDLNIETALDVACGTGRMTKELLSLDIPVVYGVDVSQEMLDNAKIFCEEKKQSLQLMQEDATNLSFEDNSFDLVISFRFLDHLPEVEKMKAIYEMVRCSRKYIVFSMANLNELTRLTQTLRRVLHRNSYEGYLINESTLFESFRNNDVVVLKRRIKLPVISMELLYFCEVETEK